MTERRHANERGARSAPYHVPQNRLREQTIRHPREVAEALVAELETEMVDAAAQLVAAVEPGNVARSDCSAAKRRKSALHEQWLTLHLRRKTLLEELMDVEKEEEDVDRQLKEVDRDIETAKRDKAVARETMVVAAGKVATVSEKMKEARAEIRRLDGDN